jgi:hypothetical protein
MNGSSGPVTPAVQLRCALERAREYGRDFDDAWESAVAHIRWPHDTTHRREWKEILGVEDQWGRPLDDCEVREVWRAAYNREEIVTPRERSLARLVAA